MVVVVVVVGGRYHNVSRHGHNQPSHQVRQWGGAAPTLTLVLSTPLSTPLLSIF